MVDLAIRDLHVEVAAEDGPREILRGVSLTIRSGETHAIMGPNGSGKSTLAYAIAGHPKYRITAGSVRLDDLDLLTCSVDERARAGVFLAMQHPVEVPGVTMSNFLRTAVTAVNGQPPKLREWLRDLKAAMASLQISSQFADRGVNEGFSGGERKRNEVLQLELLKPKIAILDETDSGLDVDAMRVVAEGVNRCQQVNDTGLLVITHTIRLLRQIPPQVVHVMAAGKIVAEGGPELADAIESDGYDQFLPAAVQVSAPAAVPASASVGVSG